MKKRIIGIDVARALAIIGMIIVNFKIAFGDSGNPMIKAIVKLFEGKGRSHFCSSCWNRDGFYVKDRDCKERCRQNPGKQSKNT